MKFRHFVLAALAMVLGAILSAPSALAFQAAAKTAVNVRSGPGTGFMIVDSLHAGEIVEVGKCKPNGWCHVRHSGPNGWVYSIYLTTAPGSSGVSDPNCGLTLTIGAGGPYLTLNCGGGVPVTPVPVPPVVTAKACFYVNRNYSGAHFCMGPGTRNWLGATFNNRISSVRTWGGAKARICRKNSLAGLCRTLSGNHPALGPTMNNRTSSMRVFMGSIPVPVPTPTPHAVHSQGAINLPKRLKANLDNGNITTNSRADILYRVVTPSQRYLKPINGAKFARGNGSARGYAACLAAAFSPARIPKSSLAPGTYVCVRTNTGRIGRFRVNSGFGPSVSLSYKTWQ